MAIILFLGFTAQGWRSVQHYILQPAQRCNKWKTCLRKGKKSWTASCLQPSKRFSTEVCQTGCFLPGTGKCWTLRNPKKCHIKTFVKFSRFHIDFFRFNKNPKITPQCKLSAITSAYLSLRKCCWVHRNPLSQANRLVCLISSSGHQKRQKWALFLKFTHRQVRNYRAGKTTFWHPSLHSERIGTQYGRIHN